MILEHRPGNQWLVIIVTFIQWIFRKAILQECILKMIKDDVSRAHNTALSMSLDDTKVRSILTIIDL